MSIIGKLINQSSQKNLPTHLKTLLSFKIRLEKEVYFYIWLKHYIHFASVKL